MITLNRNYLNSPNKRETLTYWINSEIQLDAVYRKATLNMKKREVQRKQWKKIYSEKKVFLIG